MNVLIGIVLGLIQGLTEFIPVSSSGHLVIAEQFMSGASDRLFIEWINFGTVLALLIFFRHRIWAIISEIFIKRDFRLARNIIVATLPAGLIGFTFASFIGKSSFFSSLWTVVGALFVVGIIMIVLEKLPKLSDVKSLSEVSWQRALVVGIAQVFALVPGTSRSGSTIVASRLVGLNRQHAAEFSFLVSIPIMLGVLVKLFASSSDRAYLVDNLPMLALSNLVAFVAGLFAVGFMMRYLKRHDLRLFGWYRVGLAVVIAVLLLVQ